MISKIGLVKMVEILKRQVYKVKIRPVCSNCKKNVYGTLAQFNRRIYDTMQNNNNFVLIGYNDLMMTPWKFSYIKSSYLSIHPKNGAFLRKFC